MRRFLSCSHWGLVDVTDFPFCCPIQRTATFEVWYVNPVYDGTF